MPVIRYSRLAVALAAFITAGLFAADIATMPAPVDLAKSPLAPPAASLLAGLKMTDVSGTPHSVTRDAPGGTVIVFIATECPISNGLSTELNRLAKVATEKKLAFFGVISDQTTTRADALKHRKDYKLEFPELFDASGELAAALKPTRTPQAFVLSPAGDVLYSGRINDGYSSVTRQSAEVRSNDLEDAITAVAAGKPVANANVAAVGCIFEGWDHRAGAPERTITYTRDIAPIMSANCVSCHHQGEVAPFSLMTYKDVSKRAKMLSAVTEAKIMPPWKSADPLGTFHSERHLTDAQLSMLDKWAESGAPEGDAADLPAPLTFSNDWELGKPDLIVKLPKAFAIPAAGKDIIRYFVVPIDITENKTVIGFEYRPGNRKVVHHMIAFLDSTGAGRKNAQERGDGLSYASFGGPGFVPTGSLGGWAPGSQPHLLPEGAGRRLAKGSDLVMQIHYHPSGKDETDQGELALYFAKTPVKRLAIDFPMGNRQIDIDAGNADYVRTASFTTPLEVTLFGIMPHMHNVGRTMKVTAEFPDGTKKTLIDVRDWDWNWQEQYQLREPIKLPARTKVSLEAHYDNSDKNPKNPNSPPKRIKYGEQTTDEMCLCFLQVTIDGALGELLLKAGNGGGLRGLRNRQQNPQ